MRLSQKEIKAIASAFRVSLPPNSYRLFLFGSRVDDQKRGGDIDLLLVVLSVDKSKAVSLKNRIREEIFRHISEQRIDITVATESDMKQDEFLKSIGTEAVELLETA